LQSCETHSEEKADSENKQRDVGRVRDEAAGDQHRRRSRKTDEAALLPDAP
jgi:hypothetical protein